ncbi:MAG: hypothetical protein ACI85U_003682, partial [Candidatus Promineifilaceae bacterium]
LEETAYLLRSPKNMHCLVSAISQLARKLLGRILLGRRPNKRPLRPDLSTILLTCFHKILNLLSFGKCSRKATKVDRPIAKVATQPRPC